MYSAGPVRTTLEAPTRPGGAVVVVLGLSMMATPSSALGSSLFYKTFLGAGGVYTLQIKLLNDEIFADFLRHFVVFFCLNLLSKSCKVSKKKKKKHYLNFTIFYP